jgi:hypothetical protein
MGGANSAGGVGFSFVHGAVVPGCLIWELGPSGLLSRTVPCSPASLMSLRASASSPSLIAAVMVAVSALAGSSAHGALGTRQAPTPKRRQLRRFEASNKLQRLDVA